MNNIEFDGKAINAIIGQKIQYVCRSCELVDFGFGKMFTRKNSKGNESEVASYSLHVLCPFRVTNAHHICLGSDDLFVPLSKNSSYVDLNIPGSCVFDLKAEKCQELFDNEFVKEVTITQYGDIEIRLTSTVISIFNVTSTTNESWRFFKTGKNETHLVCSGTGIEFE